MNPNVQGWPDARLDTPNGAVYLFIDGCFWHVCPQHYKRPRSRQDFWIPKVEGSNERRELARAKLPYRWMRMWEHQVDDGSYKALLSLAATSGD